MTRLIVRPAAEADIMDAQVWYSTRDRALADRFIDELRATLSRVREMH
jgi:plasmid stabilization system protein ParE